MCESCVEEILWVLVGEGGKGKRVGQILYSRDEGS